MLLNYFKVIYRNFKNNKINSAINILSLGVSLTIVILIASYVRYEFGYDKFYSNSNQVYKLLTKNSKGHDGISGFSHTSLKTILPQEFPEVVVGTFFFAQNEAISNGYVESKYSNLNFGVSDIDSNFFDVFNLKFLSGSKKYLVVKGDVVITEKAAKGLFGKMDPIGQPLKIKVNKDSSQILIVKGIVENIPKQNHFQSDVFILNKTALNVNINLKSYSRISQYVLIKEGTDIKKLEEKINKFLHLNGFESSNEIILFPVQDLHLKSIHSDRFEVKYKDIRIIYKYILVGFLILGISSVNFINLIITKSIFRLKEIGIRKFLGANSTQNLLIFFFESLFYYILSSLLALYLSYLSWKDFNHLVGINTSISYLYSIENLIVVTTFVIFMSILVTVYPAIIIYRSDYAVFFRKKITKIKLDISPQRVLIVVQVCISLFFIISTIIIHRQIHFITKKDIGFEREHLVLVKNVKKNVEVFKNNLLKSTSVKNVSYFGNTEVGNPSNITSEMKDPSDSTRLLTFSFYEIGFDLLQNLKTQLVKGRYFRQSDANLADLIYSNVNKKDNKLNKNPVSLNNLPIIITETTAKKLEINSIDTIISMPLLFGTVVGIIKDFQLTTFKNEAPLAIFRADSGNSGNAFIRIDNNDITENISFIKNTYHQLYPNDEFDFHFVEDQIQKLYEEEINQAKLFLLLSIYCIGLSMAGLLNFILIILKNKSKEIAIRKIHGASVFNLIALLSNEFLRLIITSIIISFPFIFWIMNEWLSEFAYRIRLEFWYFLIGAIPIFLIIFFAIFLRGMISAKANPVESLRDE
ncbi:ABC transporter permease [Sphingobacterium sp. HJSM2_6]|uniref:ABC transporter permease n=1 Tax=Sphingobacterium sp. HJSM2_6 TaxID=3366264 RepID=UPI003BE08A6B